MKKIIKKAPFLLTLFLLFKSYRLYTVDWATQLFMKHGNYTTALIHRRVPEMKNYTSYLGERSCALLIHGYAKRYHHLPKEVASLIVGYLYDHHMQYVNKPLPKDLSGQDLSGFNFKGCHFLGNNLTDTNLDHAVLTNTTCEYQQALLDNTKLCNHDSVFLSKNRSLFDYLTKIAELYPKMKSNAAKAVLLKIACGISRVPFHHDIDFEVKMAYWVCEWLQFRGDKNSLLRGSVNIWLSGNYLELCILGHIKLCCWITKYPQSKVSILEEAPHHKFDEYMKEFENGLVTYQCQSNDPKFFAWYQYSITQTIQELKEAYPNIKDKKLQKEVCHIAYGLSKSYQIEQMVFLNHYLSYQNRVIRLRDSARIKVKSRGCFALEKYQLCLDQNQTSFGNDFY